MSDTVDRNDTALLQEITVGLYSPLDRRHRGLRRACARSSRTPDRRFNRLHHGSSTSAITPAIKWQVSPVPGKIDLSLVAGVALPTGAIDIAGPGAQPYLQMPWSWELHDGWGVSGMLTEFFRPADMATKRITETTFSIEKKVTDKTSLFVEYVGDYAENADPSVLLNSGGLYRRSPTQQVDFRIAFGLNHNAPSYIVGVGYSFRFDGLFASRLR
jgi:hypothetical protein